MARSDTAPFAEQLRTYRRQRGLSQEALAERAGLSVQSISNLERGVQHIPRPDTVGLLADALNLTGVPRAAFALAARQPAPIAPTASPPPALSSLPLPPTPLLGRERDLEAALTLFEVGTRHAERGIWVGESRSTSPAAEQIPRPTFPIPRLLTLTGPGGVGKTHLALVVAERLRARCPDGAAFVDLTPLDDPAQVAAAIARTVGVVETSGAPLADLVGRLRERRFLLLLDNFEHVTPAAPLLAELLATCPSVLLLVTSRSPLLIRGEHELALSPLDPPAATALFLERARAVRPTLPTDAVTLAAAEEIARRLDGLPLALELAAAWVRLFTPATLLAQLGRRLPLLTGGAGDRPARHRALRDTIAWSYDLLAPEEQAAFRRLAPFIGGVPLAAALAVARAPATDATVPAEETAALRWLDGLVQRSLVRSEAGPDGAPRLVLLETVREYAIERLVASGELALARDAHAAWYLALAEEAREPLTGSAGPIWLARLDRERDNLRAALGWLMTRGDTTGGLRLGAALAGFWEARGYLREGRDQLELLLSFTPPADDPAARQLRADLLAGVGRLAYREGDYGRAIVALQECLALLEVAGREDALDPVLLRLGEALLVRGDYDQARDLFARCLARARDEGDERAQAVALHRLALVARATGDDAAAEPLAARSLALARAQDDAKGTAAALALLGALAWQRDDIAPARVHLAAALDLRRQVAEPRGLALALADACALAAAAGARVEALSSLVELLPILEGLGERWVLASCLERLGTTATLLGWPERAVRCYGAADALRILIGAPSPSPDRARQERDLATARATLGEAAFATAWHTGRTEPLAQILAATWREITTLEPEVPPTQ